MKQKFRRFTFVRVGSNMPPEMLHFKKDFDAIVDGSYSQKYGGTDIDSYAMYVLGKDGKINNAIAWYQTELLTALPVQDRLKAEELIEEYNFKRATT